MNQIGLARDAISQKVREIEASGISLYKLAWLIEQRIGMSYQYVQVERIRDTGRCEHLIGRIIEEIHSNVSRETLQNVPSGPAMEMRMA